MNRIRFHKEYKSQMYEEDLIPQKKKKKIRQDLIPQRYKSRLIYEHVI